MLIPAVLNVCCVPVYFNDVNEQQCEMIFIFLQGEKQTAELCWSIVWILKELESLWGQTESEHSWDVANDLFKQEHVNTSRDETV